MLGSMRSQRILGHVLASVGVIGTAALSLQQRRTAHALTTGQLQDMRKEYSSEGLLETGLPSEPVELFRKWIEEATNTEVPEPNAMVLATVNPETKMPSSRYVLLKGLEDDGFVWYTNYGSRKAQELESNANASLLFFWYDLQRQVRIEGTVERLSEEESDAYFSRRGRDSQLGAWSSRQGQRTDSRESLDATYQEMKSKFRNVDTIPRPPFWGGFRLRPTRIEFWKGRESRLHDRIVYERKEPNAWSTFRMQP